MEINQWLCYVSGFGRLGRAPSDRRRMQGAGTTY